MGLRDAVRLNSAWHFAAQSGEMRLAFQARDLYLVQPVSIFIHLKHLESTISAVSDM